MFRPDTAFRWNTNLSGARRSEMLLQENKALQATGEIRDRLEALAKTNLCQAPDAYP